MQFLAAELGTIDSGARSNVMRDRGLIVGNCKAMRVDYLTDAHEITLPAAADEVVVVIPGEEAACRLGSDGPEGPRTEAIRSPHIAVLPHAATGGNCRLTGLEAMVITLDLGFYREKIRSALGFEAPAMADRMTLFSQFVTEIGKSLREEFKTRHGPCCLYLETWASVIAIHLASRFRGCIRSRDWAPGLPDHKLRRVLAFIDAHLADPIPVRELATTVHMSPYHFARMFKRASGQSPHAYITVRRVDCAKALLRASALSLVDVAAKAGFQNQAHFTEVFRKRVGVTPRAFRLSYHAALYAHNEIARL